MGVEKLEKHILAHLSELNQQILKTPKQPTVDELYLVLNEYEKNFTALFGDGTIKKGYTSEIKDKADKEKLHFFLSCLSQLEQSIQELPVQSTIKKALLIQISNNCDLDLLKKFNKGPLSTQEYQQLINHIQHKNKPIDSAIDTIVVRTWGTVHEEGSGLRNVMRQQVQGEGIGHASISMRFKADEQGRDLIKNYCLNEDMSKKIPFQMKQYGNEAVYEVYFSYWPTGLSVLDEDILAESSSVGIKEDVDILKEMPLELKSRYLYQKYKHELNFSIPVPEVLRGSGRDHVLTSEFKGFHKIALPPTAILDAAEIEPNAEHRVYLDLKVKQYLINEEVSSLKVLFENYFEKDAQTPGKIRDTSNFLILLKRFRTQLSERQITAKVLLEHKITKDELSKIKKDVLQLLDNKKIQTTALNRQILKAAEFIQENVSEIHSLQTEIDDLQADVAANQRSKRYLDAFLPALDKNSGTLPFTEEDKAAFKKFEGIFNDPNSSKSIDELAKGKKITRIRAHFLRIALENYKNTTLYKPEQLAEIKIKIIEKMEQLRTLYNSNKEKKIIYAQNQLKETEELIFSNATKIRQNSEELASVKKQFEVFEQLSEPKGTKPSDVSFHNKEEFVQIIKQLEDIRGVLESDKETLQKIKGDTFAHLVQIKLNPPTSAEEIAQRKIKRGSSNDVVLKGFNIEAMLKKASQLATPGDTTFHLSKENCSTTCMKLLEAGAPKEQSEFFQWDPSKTLLPNPQAVFSAAKGVARGDTVNETYRRKVKSDKDYNVLVNQLIGSKTSSDQISKHMEEKTAGNKFSWYNYLKFLPHLIKLYSDIYSVVPLEHDTKNTSLQAKVVTEIKNLGGEDYHLIRSLSAPLAIHQMLHLLKNNKHTVPFFDNETLSRVESYILTLEAKPGERTTEDELALSTFKNIETERDMRIHCIEQCILSGTEVKDALSKRESSVEYTTFKVCATEKTDALVSQFIATYREQRNEQKLSFLATNFVAKIDGIDSSEKKLGLIVEHILKNPKSRSQRTMEACLKSDPSLAEVLPEQLRTSFVVNTMARKEQSPSIDTARTLIREFKSEVKELKPKEEGPETKHQVSGPFN
jgi:hypothetical protein